MKFTSGVIPFRYTMSPFCSSSAENFHDSLQEQTPKQNTKNEVTKNIK